MSSSRPGVLDTNGSALGRRAAGVSSGHSPSRSRRCAVRSGDGAVVVGVAVVSNTISTGRAISISPSMRA